MNINTQRVFFFQTESYEIVRTFPPPYERYRKKGKIPTLKLKNEHLMKNFYKTYPEEKVRLVALKDEKTFGGGIYRPSSSTGSNFVERQLELMKKGMSEQDAFDAVDVIFQEELKKKAEEEERIRLEAEERARVAAELEAERKMTAMEEERKLKKQKDLEEERFRDEI